MTRPLPPHTDAAHAAITAELVRLTLPHPADSDRPSLECPIVDTATAATGRRRRKAARR